jgi:G6PDH family F420-dependent oxidoreductase
MATGWPPVNVRHERLAEPIEIISALFEGEYLTYVGDHYRVDSAKLWDLPTERVPIGVAVSGQQGIETFAPMADAMIAVEPKSELVSGWDAAHEGPSRKIGQLPVSWDTDRDAAVRRAHEQFRWFGGGWKVNSEIPGPAGFAAASQFVRPDDVAESIPCGADADAVVEAAAAFWQAGFTDIALVQIGGDVQEPFIAAAESTLLPALRKAAPRT